MIARTWVGRTKARHADAYLQVLRDTGLRDLRGTPGNRGVWLLRREDGDNAEFLLISLWDSLASIRVFAGPDADHARYYPEDDAYLHEKPEHVRHYEVVDMATCE